jgi:hypothetical protein
LKALLFFVLVALVMVAIARQDTMERSMTKIRDTVSR